MSRARGALGRPTKLDDLTAKRIVDAVREGHSYAAAARAGRIAENTLHNWLGRGRDGDPDYVGFLRRVEEADHEAEHRCVAVLKNALEGTDAKLATDTAWKWLARRRPAQWSEKPVEAKAGADDEQTVDDIAVTRSVLAALESRKAG